MILREHSDNSIVVIPSKTRSGEDYIRIAPANPQMNLVVAQAVLEAALDGGHTKTQAEKYSAEQHDDSGDDEDAED